MSQHIFRIDFLPTRGDGGSTSAALATANTNRHNTPSKQGLSFTASRLNLGGGHGTPATTPGADSWSGSRLFHGPSGTERYAEGPTLLQSAPPTPAPGPDVAKLEEELKQSREALESAMTELVETRKEVVGLREANDDMSKRVAYATWARKAAEQRAAEEAETLR